MSSGASLIVRITIVVCALGLVALFTRRVRPYTLALGFGATAVQWMLAYIAMIGVGKWIGEGLFALTALAPIAIGFLSQRFARKESGAWSSGLVNGMVNVLIVGSVVGGKDAQAAVHEAIYWTLGIVAGSSGLAALGGIVARRNEPREGVLPPPICLFAIVASSTLFLLLVTGGLVTGLEAGLAVPDWPNTFGHNMLMYPISEMKGGVYYEHAHRLFGMLVGLNALVLAALCWRHESRGWVRVLATLMLVMVCGQGLLGGLRVTGSLTLEQNPSLLQPSTALAIVHGIFGQIVFAVLITVASVTTATWLSPSHAIHTPAGNSARLWALIAPIILLVQLFLGAAFRHLQVTPTDAAKAISYPAWAMHGHLGFAMVAVIVVMIAASRLAGIGRSDALARPLAVCATTMVSIVSLQVVLGFVALGAVLMRRGAAIPLWELVSTTAHQVIGALLLAAAVQGTVWSRRLLAGSSAA